MFLFYTNFVIIIYYTAAQGFFPKAAITNLTYSKYETYFIQHAACSTGNNIRRMFERQ